MGVVIEVGATCQGNADSNAFRTHCRARRAQCAGSAYLELADADRDIEAGDYEFYAGPEHDTTAAACVRWGGSVGSVSFGSPLEHCR